VDEGSSVGLDASGSSDPDGSIADTEWAVVDGPGSVSGSTYEAPDSVGNDEATVEVTITDDDGATDTDTATVDIQDVNEPPNADAGGPYTVDEGSSVGLDASGSSDPDGSIADTDWTVVDGPGSVSGSTYEAPDDVDQDVEATVEVTVTDDDGATDTDTAIITIEDTDGGEPPSLPGAENPPADPDGDGVYEDINGDGDLNIFDVQMLFDNLDTSTVQNHPSAYDFAGLENGRVEVFDVQALYNEM